MAVAVGSGFIGLILKSLADSAQSYVAEKHKWYPGMKGSLETLWRQLFQIQAETAGSIDKLENEQAEVNYWLNQLGDLAFYAEDVLDRLNYEMLKAKLKKKSQVASFLSFHPRGVKVSIGNSSSLMELKKLLLKLNRLHNNLPILAGCENREPDLKLTTASFVVGEKVIFGRDKDREEIIMSLLYPDYQSSSGGDGVSVVVIVGCGGVGKTTLAQLVYNDERVQEHFDLHMWACASNCFDEIDLSKSIMRAVTGSVPDGMQDLSKIQDELRATLASKRFLLVIDDVWNDEKKSDLQNREIWRTVLAPLQSGKKGSRIVVTTRVKIVADMIGADVCVCLNLLSDNYLWFLFKDIALGNEAPDAFPELQDIGKRIVARLYGLPLAAISVGNLLRCSRAPEQWQAILDRDIFPENISALMSSYLHLPEHLQQCFSFCGILPKGLMFDSSELVHMWIAEGFVGGQKEIQNPLEVTANEYINQLVSRSFFQLKRHGDKVRVCIHDLLHDLASHVSSKFFARIESNKPKQIPPTIRHLSVHGDSSFLQLKHICKLQKLRTLVIFESPRFFFKHTNIFKELRSLRILDLKGCQLFDLPENLGELVHLRFLGLCDTLRWLPDSVCKLLHLQVLVIPNKSQLDKLPEGMNKLISLHHLKMETKYIAMIPGIGTLTNLQDLAEFYVRKENGWTIRELRDLRYLSGQLSIKRLENIGSKEEAREADLANKGLLSALTLEWSSFGRRDRPIMDAQVLEGLRPHPNIKKLHLSSYQGALLPGWLVDRGQLQLKYLHLSNCPMLVSLPSLGELPFLKVLHIKGMSSINLVGHEFYGKGNIAFPALEDLMFADMPKWAVWSSRANAGVFPSLKSLKISGCPNLFEMPLCPSAVRQLVIERAGGIECLKLLPNFSCKPSTFSCQICCGKNLCECLLAEDHLKAVQSLDIRRCQLAQISTKFDFLISLKTLRISQCDVTNEELDKFLLNMRPLYSLEIDGCLNLTKCPLLVIHSTSLHELCIRDCSELSSLRAIENLISLKSLVIERCPKVTVFSIPYLKSLTSLKKLSILSCRELQSLPEDGLPPSVEMGHFVGCGQTLMENLHNRAAPDWAKVACIPNIVIL